MLYKVMSIPLDINHLHVEVKTKKGEIVTCVFRDLYQILNGKIELNLSARELFLMTKNKHPYVQRIWETTTGEYLSEKTIESFGDTYYIKKTKNILVRKNRLTGSLRS